MEHPFFFLSLNILFSIIIFMSVIPRRVLYLFVLGSKLYFNLNSFIYFFFSMQHYFLNVRATVLKVWGAP